MQVGPMDRWSVPAAELFGILYAISIINKVALRHWRTSLTRARTATILNDSKSALLAVQNHGNKSGRQITHAILREARNTRTHGTSIRLQWTPGHCQVPRNDAADLLAKEAAVPGKHTRSAFCCRKIEHTSSKRPTPNGRKNGTSRAPAPIYVRSTIHYRPSTPDNSTALCLEIERTY